MENPFQPHDVRLVNFNKDAFEARKMNNIYRNMNNIHSHEYQMGYVPKSYGDVLKHPDTYSDHIGMPKSYGDAYEYENHKNR